MEYTYNRNIRRLSIQYLDQQIIHYINDDLYTLFNRKIELRLPGVSMNSLEWIRLKDIICEKVERVAMRYIIKSFKNILK